MRTSKFQFISCSCVKFISMHSFSLCTDFVLWKPRALLVSVELLWITQTEKQVFQQLYKSQMLPWNRCQQVVNCYHSLQTILQHGHQDATVMDGTKQMDLQSSWDHTPGSFRPWSSHQTATILSPLVQNIMEYVSWSWKAPYLINYPLSHACHH